ncbi:bifunctional nuclease family protein [Natronomonas halophila]|jgi:bifunctional DNase/RNase|uniref:bifunctional nuclease family protein n=1 Tax=Natronomonas halophila TaxID=2747817 RepID=UPI0015B4176E|nr:bifunctional nuclease family protein [Natronomonas halophila]QLD86501.1 bifunctional nuclease family protein [Natronomonas halophila]
MTHEATVHGLGVSVEEGGDEGAPVVVLRARDEAIPIFISADQAKSISHALEGRPFERPLTHDLFVEMLTEFGGAIDRVRIDDLSENTFLAKIDAERYADGERREVVLDARPSDAIAIALRVDCPIRVSDEVLEAAGQPPDAFEVK